MWQGWLFLKKGESQSETYFVDVYGNDLGVWVLFRL